jgi:hypothetical protein
LPVLVRCRSPSRTAPPRPALNNHDFLPSAIGQ